MRNKRASMPNVVVLDISTTPMGSDYRFNWNREYRLERAPEMLSAVVYVVKKKKYLNFLPDCASDLIACLEEADELVTFHGKIHDTVVLQARYGLSAKIALSPRHTDLGEIVERTTGSFAIFKDLIALNLKEDKLLVDTLTHDPVRRTDSLKACRSDVRQTYQLWKRYKAGTLKLPGGAVQQPVAVDAPKAARH